MRLSLVLYLLSVACGGATTEPAGPAGPPAPAAPAGEASSEPPDECASPAAVIAKSGTAVRQAPGSAQRFELVYQGSDLGVAALRGVNMIIAGSDGPFSPDKHAGYWAEVRDPSGNTTYTRLLQDPTRIEGPGPNGGFANATVDRCVAKTILVDVPRSPRGSVLVVFGMVPGARRTASELGRFTLE